ncbi:MAG: response regulator [Rhodococcus sp. (in: high G+C Gram-positive bacteria)]
MAVVDDQVLVRSGFVVLLNSEPDVEIVGEASDGQQAWDLCRHTVPDVVLMDVRMPVMNGIEATRSIVTDPACATSKVLILTTFDDDELVVQALQAGASGFLLKDTRPDLLLDAITVIAAGEALLSPSVTRRMIERFAALPDSKPRTTDDGLTGREREVLHAVSQGLSNNEIAVELHMGYGTVKTHVSHLLTKLNCRDRAQLVVFAYESGLTIPGA